MKVHELAKELGQTSAQVIELLGGDIMPMSNLDEDSVEAVRSASPAPDSDTAEAPAPEEAPAPVAEAVEEGPEIVRFWSEVMKHAFDVNGQLVRFKNFLIDVYTTNPATGEPGAAYNALKDLIPFEADIRIVVNEPFKDLGARKDFRQLLEEKIFTGPNREASPMRGMGFLEALFPLHEHDLVAKTLHQHGVAGLIELATSTKSFKDTL